MTLPANDEGAVRAAPNLDDLQEFSDFIIAGLPLVRASDDHRWTLGDIAARFEVKLGRPADGEDAPTLGDLAAAWDVETPRVSEWRSVAAFYPNNVRLQEHSWTHHNMARRAARGSLDNALELLHAAGALHLGVAAFRRYIKGEVWEGPVPYEFQPPAVQAANPQRWMLWATFKRSEVDEE